MGIDLMGPFLTSFINKYIKMAINYISKWVETCTLPTNNALVVLRFPKENIFTRFETP